MFLEMVLDYATLKHSISIDRIRVLRAISSGHVDVLPYMHLAYREQGKHHLVTVNQSALM